MVKCVWWYTVGGYVSCCVLRGCVALVGEEVAMLSQNNFVSLTDLLPEIGLTGHLAGRRGHEIEFPSRTIMYPGYRF